ncbi:MAG: ATP-binding protein [Halobacteriota archaeon]
MEPLFVAHVVAFAVAALASFATVGPASRVDHPDTRYGLVGLLFTSGVWGSAQALYLVVPGVVLKEALYMVGLVAGIVSVLAWLYFSAAYSGRAPREAPYARAVVGIVAAFVLVKVTNPIHNGYFTAEMASEPFAHLAIQYGMVHWMAMGLSYALAFVGFYMLAERFAQASVGTRPLEALVLLTALPLGLDLLALQTPWLLALTYEPLGVAAFAVGTVTVYFERFQTVQLAADVDDPVFVLDAEGRVASVNDQATSLFPDAADRIGEPLESVAPQLRRALDDDRVLTVEDPEGPRFFQISTSPFVAGSTETGRVVILSDVTEREQYRRDLERKTEQLQLLNRIVRHDIRNEMSVVIGWGEILEEQVDADDEDALRRLLGAANQVVDLTDGAREFIRALDEDERPDTTAVDLARTLEAEVDKQRSAHPDADITIEGALPETTVRANEMLTSVFRNLIGNAIENVDTGPPTITVSAEERPETAVVRIADNGPGIPDDRKESVFQMGEKGADSGGTGIGLYLVQTLVGQYGGTVRIEDNEPRGSVFVVELPLAGQ